MDFLHAFMTSQKAELVKQLSGSFSIEEQQVETALSSMFEKIRTHAAGSLDMANMPQLIAAFNSLPLENVLAGPQALDSAGVQQQGQAILDMLFTDSNAGEEIAKETAQETSITAEKAERMLAAVMAAVAGYLKGFLGNAGGLSDLLQGSEAGDLLGGLLGSTNGRRDGDVADMLRKLF